MSAPTAFNAGCRRAAVVAATALALQRIPLAAPGRDAARYLAETTDTAARSNAVLLRQVDRRVAAFPFARMHLAGGVSAPVVVCGIPVGRAEQQEGYGEKRCGRDTAAAGTVGY